MGGQIWVESAVGKGSTFSFTVDAGICELPGFLGPGSRQSDAISGEVLGKSEFDPGMAERLPLRILMVEDNLINVEVTQMMLHRLGYLADIAANGKEAVDALHRQPYDVVLMDLHMPEMNGLEATRSIRECLPENRQPFIIAMTANAMKGDREMCEASGMDEYISKPILPCQLMEKLMLSRTRAARPYPCETDGTLPVDDSRAASRTGEGEPFDVLDQGVLDRLRKQMGERADEKLPKLVADFCIDARNLQLRARQALVEGKLAELERLAHTLKSTSAALGVTALSKYCYDLEKAASKGNMDGLNQLLHRIASEWQRVEAVLSCPQGIRKL